VKRIRPLTREQKDRKNQLAREARERGGYKQRVFTSPITSAMIGQTYGRLKVMGIAQYRNKYGNVLVVADCSCGKPTVKKASDIREGKVKSCGCLLKEQGHRIGKETQMTTRRLLAECINEMTTMRKHYSYDICPAETNARAWLKKVAPQMELPHA
jgi:hypothetical protein